MKWKVTAPNWARSETGHGICKALNGRYAAWRDWRFLGWADDKNGAMRLCEKDDK